MRKLTPQQINTIAYLHGEGIRTIVIARTLQMMAGVALSATYHHVTKLETASNKDIKERIKQLVRAGHNTSQVADLIGMDLGKVNKLYLR